MKVIAISNQKGGVAKTTTACTLATGLGLNGSKVLLIDLDSQGNVADSYGLEHGDELSQMLNPFAPVELSKLAIKEVQPNLDVIRSYKRTAELKKAIAGQDFREYILLEALKNTSVEYDYVFLDCAPSIDILLTNALVAADFLIIPTKLEQMSIKGIRDALQTMASLKHNQRSHCAFIGILPTFFDRRMRESFRQLKHLQQAFGGYVWSPIPVDAICPVASREGKTIWEYAAESRALNGLEINGKHMGGYRSALDKFQECVK
jgi:chromosome partitioning protein